MILSTIPSYVNKNTGNNNVHYTLQPRTQTTLTHAVYVMKKACFEYSNPSGTQRLCNRGANRQNSPYFQLDYKLTSPIYRLTAYASAKSGTLYQVKALKFATDFRGVGLPTFERAWSRAIYLSNETMHETSSWKEQKNRKASDANSENRLLTIQRSQCPLRWRKGDSTLVYWFRKDRNTYIKDLWEWPIEKEHSVQTE